VPAAAVIPALIACIKIAAVKTLVVALQRLMDGSTPRVRTHTLVFKPWLPLVPFIRC
jgi:hypothetical protein